jgi:hypothetical protein
MVAFHMLPLLEAEAKERQIRKPLNSVPEILPEQTDITTQLTEDLPQAGLPPETLTVETPASVSTPKDSRDQAAAMVGVSGKYVSDIKSISKQAPDRAFYADRTGETVSSPTPKTPKTKLEGLTPSSLFRKPAICKPSRYNIKK